MRHEVMASGLATLLLAILGAVATPVVPAQVLASAATVAPGDMLQSRSISVGSGGSGANGALLLPDGGLVMAGLGVSSSADLAVAVLKPDFTLDSAFNGDGKGLYPIDLFAGAADEVLAVARQPDGKLLLCASAQNPRNQGTSTRYDTFAVLRINPDGSVDTGFGNSGNGVVLMEDLIPERSTDEGLCQGIAVLADGKILAVGYAGYIEWSVYEWRNGVVAVRLLADGNPDPTFGSGGTVFYDNMGYAQGLAVTLDASGRSYIAGIAYPHGADGTSAYLAMRLRPDGTLDTSYNESGYLVVASGDHDSFGNTIHLLADGSVYVGGGDKVAGHDVMSLLKLTPDGQLQTSFGDGGRAVADFPAQGSYQKSLSHGLAVQPDGRIVLGGYSLNASGERQIALARFLPAGGLDPVFGELQPGMSTYPIGTDVTDSVANAVEFNPVSGELNVVGYGKDNGIYAFLALRVEAGNTDLIFANGFEATAP